jgi:hypothetical protein
MTIRSKHNDLLNYFIHDPRDLSRAYVRSCEKFFKELDLIIAKTEKERNKFKASSSKPQASSATKKPQLNNRINK